MSRTHKLGRLILAKREGKGWSQTKLADEAGVSQPAVSDWEQGLKSPSIQSLFALRDAFPLDAHEFEVWLELAGQAKRKRGVA